MNNTTNHPSKNKKNGENILLSLTYIGKNSKKNNGIELTRVLERWRRNNEESDITSALAINDHYLIQNIEGSRPIINEVLAILLNDYPHLLPHIIEIEEIKGRRWNGFLIKYLTSSIEDEEYTLKSFSAGYDFNPYLMKSTQITEFLTSIFDAKAPQIEEVI